MQMQYPLEEKIGPPDLLVGRKYEFDEFNWWLDGIPGKLSKSRVILARRKSGKTSFVQRIFNQLWSQNGQVVPFYFDIADQNIWLHKLAINYYTAFTSQYISFLERDPVLVSRHLSLEKIHAYAVEKNLDGMRNDTEYMLDDLAKGERDMDILWNIATHAPHRYASGTNTRFLVILDEFQNIANHVYRNEGCEGKPDDSMPGSFHSLSESKVAPMLVTGSYPGILMDIMAEHLEAGRLSIFEMNPYLTSDEGLKAVRQYAKVYRATMKDETERHLNKLCMSDPFLISCVILNRFPGKTLITKDGVVAAVNYEITNRSSEMSKTWAEYLRRTFRKVNGTTTKKLMLFLNKHNQRDWTPKELRKELNLDLSEEDVYERLVALEGTDVIQRINSDIDFRGLADGTLKLVLRHRFEKEIEGVEPNFKEEFEAQLAEAKDEADTWRGRAADYKGKLAERNLVIEFHKHKQIRLSDYFTGVSDSRLFTIAKLQERVSYQRLTGKNEEIDIIIGLWIKPKSLAHWRRCKIKNKLERGISN
ncbi:MAG: hypothetical protein AAF639_47720, partial [Chloroflexota bacterium]